MFTGLVDDVGTIESVAETRDGLELRVRCRYDDLADGESIAVNGACLTVTGMPASNSAMRATLRLSSPAWFAQP